MTRAEFTKPTKRLALKRAEKRCEGIVDGQRCNGDLSQGVEFDHADADWFSKDNSLENCACLCVLCHKAKTKRDVKLIAKSKRISDRHSGIKKSSRFPGARNSKLKFKIGGGVVDRATGNPIQRRGM